MRIKQFFFLLLLILSPLIIGFYFPKSADATRYLFDSAVRPVLSAWHGVYMSGKGGIEFASKLKSAFDENKKLKEDIEVLRAQTIALSETQKENERLRKLVKFQQDNQGKAIAAQVIGRDLSRWSFYVVISKGEKQGISENMPAVVGDGLVGKVVNVSSNSSDVILLTDPDSRVSAIVQETRDIGLIAGNGGPFLRMTYIDLHSTIQPGQVVMTSGLGGIYPKGIPIGTVVQVGKEENHLSLYAEIRPFVSFSKLEEVLCLNVKT